MNNLKTIWVSILIAASLSACALKPSQQEIESADYGPYPSDYENIIKQHMSNRLKDPYSAQYQFLGSPRSGWNSFGGMKFGYGVCAYINAKNSYGGYTGNKIHFFMINNGYVVKTIPEEGDFTRGLIEGFCRN